VGVGRKISRGGPTEKRLKSSKKDQKIALLSLFRGGGQGKNSKIDQKILASIYYICTMYENSGRHGPLLFLPDADAHGLESRIGFF